MRKLSYQELDLAVLRRKRTVFRAFLLGGILFSLIIGIFGVTFALPFRDSSTIYLAKVDKVPFEPEEVISSEDYEAEIQSAVAAIISIEIDNGLVLQAIHQRGMATFDIFANGSCQVAVFYELDGEWRALSLTKIAEIPCLSQ